MHFESTAHYACSAEVFILQPQNKEQQTVNPKACCSTGQAMFPAGLSTFTWSGCHQLAPASWESMPAPFTRREHCSQSGTAQPTSQVLP